MEQTLSITRSSRQTLLNFMESYTLEQLNTIPPHFNNNIIWNIGHIIVVQQMLAYNLSGLPMMVSDELVSKYKRGTKPESDVTREELDELRSLLFSTIDQTEKDLENGIFTKFHTFTTMSGFTLNDVQTAIKFNNYHEGVHVGAILGIRKFI